MDLFDTARYGTLIPIQNCTLSCFLSMSPKPFILFVILSLCCFLFLYVFLLDFLKLSRKFSWYEVWYGHWFWRYTYLKNTMSVSIDSYCSLLLKLHSNNMYFFYLPLFVWILIATRSFLHSKFLPKQGRIHGYLSRVWVSRGHIWGQEAIWAGAVGSRK